MNKIRLVLGDESNDGHGLKEVYFIESNLEALEVEKAYRLGTEKCGLDFHSQVCKQCGENTIQPEIVILLAEQNLITSEMKESIEQEDYWLDREMFLHIWLQIALLGNPHLTYEIISDDMPEISIGGYGLFVQ